MSYLIKQTENNDCGPALCTMVLKNQYGLNYSLEKFKIENEYNHEQYSFAEIKLCLTKYQIKSQVFEFEDLIELKLLKKFICFQVINEVGLNHFILGKFLKNQRWLILDSAKNFPLVWSDKELLKVATKNILIFDSDKNILTKPKSIFWRFLFQIFKTNYLTILITNSLWILNLFLITILNAFIRIIFQEYQYFSFKRLLLLTLSLTLVVCLILTLNYLIKILNQFSSNSTFDKILKANSFQSKFYQTVKYLKQNDLENLFYRFQNNIILVINLLNSCFSWITFFSYVLIYFFSINQFLMFSSIILVMFLLILKYWKIKTIKKRNLSQQSSRWFWLLEWRKVFQKIQFIEKKTLLRNFLTVKKLNSLNLNNDQHFLEKYQLIERWFISFYYLVLCWLLIWQNQSITFLIVFTSISLIFVNHLEQWLQFYFSFDFSNFFNESSFDLKVKVKNVSLPLINFKKNLIKDKILYLKTEQLKDLLFDYLPIKDWKEEIYFSNEAINDQEIIYHNIFNYQRIDLTIFKVAKIQEILDENNLDLSLKPQKENIEIIKYLSCFFTERKILVVNLPKEQKLVTRLIETFPNKIIIFLKNED